MKSVEGIGKNIEQAIENALFELKAPREDVDIKILCEGGLFKKAKVIVSISEDAREKYEKKEEKRKTLVEDSDGVCIKKNVVKEVEKENKSIIQKIETKKDNPVVKEETLEEKVDVVKKERFSKVIPPQEFLENLFKKINKDVCIEKIEEEEITTYSITGGDIGDFIGYRGETLFSISYLTSILAGKTQKKVVVDIENYRSKRIETLQNLAKRTAEKVIKTSRYVKLEPMDPSERRVVHMALQNNDRVTTLSKGTEPHRFIMIFPREYKE